MLVFSLFSSFLLLMMSYSESLAAFYNAEAKKYHQTRKKYWSEGKLLLETLEKYDNNHLNILELGCGGGRLITLLENEDIGKFSYTGVDISQGLLEHAQQEHPQQRFVCAHMLDFLTTVPQESVDIIFACASFQHLKYQEERIAVMKNAYRALKYGGMLIFTNRAFSKWFLKTHRPIFLRSAFLSLFNFGRSNWRDVFIPRKTKEGSYQRYYHLFSLDELKKLAELSGFSVEELVYLDQKAQKTLHWEGAKNSFLVARKKVFL